MFDLLFDYLFAVMLSIYSGKSFRSAGDLERVIWKEREREREREKKVSGKVNGLYRDKRIFRRGKRSFRDLVENEKTTDAKKIWPPP